MIFKTVRGHVLKRNHVMNSSFAIRVCTVLPSAMAARFALHPHCFSLSLSIPMLLRLLLLIILSKRTNKADPANT